MPPRPGRAAGPPRRAFGIALMAVVILVVSLFGLASAFASTAESLGFEQPAAWRALLAATSVLGIWTAWAIWRPTRHAEGAYLLWAAAGTVATLYWIVVLAPTMIAIGAEVVGLPEPPRVTPVAWGTALAIHVAFLALGWWYLHAALRRGSPPHDAGTAVP